MPFIFAVVAVVHGVTVSYLVSTYLCSLPTKEGNPMSWLS